MILSAGCPSPLASAAHPKTSVPWRKSMKKLHYEELTQKEEEKILNCNKKSWNGKHLALRVICLNFMFYIYIKFFVYIKEDQKKEKTILGPGISYKCLRYPLPPPPNYRSSIHSYDLDPFLCLRPVDIYKFTAVSFEKNWKNCWSGHVSSSLWSNVSKVTSLQGHCVMSKVKVSQWVSECVSDKVYWAGVES